MPKTVIINPPLDLPEIFIDNPAFNFYAPLTLFNFLKGGGNDVCFVDAFPEGAIRKEGGRFLLGLSWETVVDRVVRCTPDSVIICNSPFQRAEGLLNPILKGMINALAAEKTEVILADIYDTTTHYLDYDSAYLKKIYPGVAAIYKKYFPYHLHKGFPEGGFLFKLPLDQVAKYSNWLNLASTQGIIKDNSNGEKIFPYMSSEGCDFACQFCTSGKNLWKALSASQVIDDIQSLVDQGVERVFFTDPYANFDQNRFKKIIGFCSANHIKIHFTNGLGLAHIDEETAILLSDTVDNLYISPEHLSNNILSLFKKPFDEDMIKEKIELLGKCNVNVNAHFILGSPGEKREDANLLLDGAWELFKEKSVNPFFQLYNSRDDLFVRGEKTTNIYRKFLPTECGDGWLKRAFANFAHKFNATDEQKIIINVTYRCNNHCVFCAVGDRQRKDGNLKQQLALIRESYERGIRLLDIDGGEPLLYREIFTLLDAGRDYSAINITTNGRMLRLKSFARRLSEYENLKILISLHGATQDIHEKLTGSVGSFSQTITGLRNAVNLFEDVGVNFTVTSINYQSLLDTAKLVASLGVISFNVQLYTPFGNVDRELAPPPEAMVLVYELIDKFAKKLRISLINYTFCQAPDLAQHMVADYFKVVRQMLFVNGELVNLSDYLARKRFKDSKCLPCEFSVICRGHWDYQRQQASPSTYQSTQIDRSSSAKTPLKLLDIIPGYACNRKCVFCTATSELRQSNLNSEALFAKVREAMLVYDPEKIRIGGGEPTIRKDLLSLIRYFCKEGIPQISIQTNGLMLAYESYLENLILAGLTGVNISVPAIDHETHGKLTGVKNSWPLVEKAIDNICKHDLHREIDILISKPVVSKLGEMTEYFLKKGISYLNFWYISVEGNVIPRVETLVPTMTEAARALSELFNSYRDHDLKVFYLPYCFLPEWPDKVWHPLDENAFVITPGQSFFLEKGEIDIGEKVKRCKGCRWYNKCFGIRKNYLDVFGDSEIQPVD